MTNLRSINLSQFRIHRDTRLENVEPLLVLVGKNDTGKSSVMKALDVVFNGVSESENDGKISITENDVRFDKKELLPKMGVEVSFDDGYCIRTTFDADMKPVFEKVSGIDLDARQYKDRYLYKLFSAEGPYDSSIEGKTVSDLLNTKLDGLPLEIKSPLEAIVKPWEEALKEYLSSPIEISKHGTGVRRLCSMFNFLLSQVTEMRIDSKQLIVAIEEPEISLYPNQQRELVKALVKNRRALNFQLIISTHSVLFVQELKEVMELDKIDGNSIVILKWDEDAEGNKISDNINTDLSPFQNRVIKHYLSLNEVNYLAFGESSVEYHIELFAYIQNRLIEKYENDSDFRASWDKKIKRKTKDKSDETDMGATPDEIRGVNAWFKLYIDSKEVHNYYRVDKADVPIENNTLPVCVRNNIDHPYNLSKEQLDKYNADPKKYKKELNAYNTNKSYGNRRKESIRQMIEAISKNPDIFNQAGY